LRFSVRVLISGVCTDLKRGQTLAIPVINFSISPCLFDSFLLIPVFAPILPVEDGCKIKLNCSCTDAKAVILKKDMLLWTLC
jgi:hypothetical protein